MKTETMIEAIGMIDEELVRDAKNVRTVKKRRYVKTTALAAALLIVMFLTLPVATALGSDEAYGVLYRFSPAIAQSFKLVRQSCVDQGIRMEIISAKIEGDTAQFFLSLRDLEEDRVDRTTDLFDSYYIYCPFDSSAHISFSEFDEETKSIYYVVEIERMDGQEIANDKITFCLRNLLFKKQKIERYLDEVDLSRIVVDPETVGAEELSFSGGSYVDEKPIEEEQRYLIPGDTANIPITDGVTLTGLAYIDGVLHIQTHFDDISHTDNHGWICLMDENGDPVYSDRVFDIAFWDDAHSGSYEERFQPVMFDEMMKCRLYGKFTTCSGFLEGRWEVTFRMSDLLEA